MALFVVAVGIPVAIAVHYHSIGAPNSDDWAYDRSTFHLAYHGGFDLYHWGPSNLVGQFILAVPVVWVFGEHVWALNLWTCAVGLGGLLALDYLGRQIGLSRRASLFASALLGLGPMWASLSTSFMSDIPSLAFMTMAVAIAASDTRVDRIVTPRWVLSLLVAGLAFAIRDETVVAIGVIAWCRLWRCGRPSRRQVLGWAPVVAVLVIALAGFELWRLAIPTGGQPSGSMSPSMQWAANQWFLPLGGLMLAPAAAFIGPVRTIKGALRAARTWTVMAWAVVPALPVLIYLRENAPFILITAHDPVRMVGGLAPAFGNAYFNTMGYAPGPGYEYLPLTVLFVLGLVSITSMIVVVAAMTHGAHEWWTRTRTKQPSSQAHYIAMMLALATVGSWVVFAAGIGWDLQAWDRYLLPEVAYIPILVMYVRGRSDVTCRSDAAGRPPRAPWWNARLGLSALAGLALLSAIATFAVDGFVGSESTYSDRFAASVPATPRRLIDTVWTWTSTQDEKMILTELNFRPCYAEQIDARYVAGDLDYVHAGSWVEHYTYDMLPYAHHPQTGCNYAGSKLSAFHNVTRSS